MIFSAQQLFSDNQAIIATAASTNILDTLATGTPAHAAAALEKDLGKGTVVPIDITVTEVFNTLTSLNIAVQVDNDVAFGSPKTVMSEDVLLAALVVGFRTGYQYLQRGTDERYLRILYTVTGTDPTTGEIHAGITAGNEDSWNR